MEPTQPSQHIDAECQSPWADQIPEELLLGIFKLLSAECGPVPLLCRVAQVCRYWKEIAYHWELWQHINLSSGWINKSLQGLSMLGESRFGDDTVGLHLEAWFKLADADLITISQYCPRLQELDLSSCLQLSADGLCVVADNFPQLKSIRLANMAPIVLGHKAVSYFLQKKGPLLEKLVLANADVTKHFQKSMQHLAMYCSALTHLELTGLNFLDGEKLTLYVAKLQFGCPKLEVLNLSGTPARFYNPREDQIRCPGFPKLVEYHAPIEENSSEVSLGSAIVLSHSYGLKKLVLEKNCHNLDQCPATDLEYLRLPEGAPAQMLSQIRWRHSLRVLDLSWLGHRTRRVMDGALKSCFSHDKPEFEQLREVWLCGTVVSWHALCYVVERCRGLRLLNCTLCPNVPRFWCLELRGELLRLLYRLVNEQLSGEQLSQIQSQLQVEMLLPTQTTS